MNLDLIKQVLAEQQNEMKFVKKHEEWVPRPVQLNIIEQSLQYPNIMAILGVRRSGKSTLAMMYCLTKSERTLYVNFDDERLISIKTKELNLILIAGEQLFGPPSYIILDEIQNVSGWELFVNRLRRSQKKIIITGSNANLLSGELAIHLTGRYLDVMILPFSFVEVLHFKQFPLMDSVKILQSPQNRPRLQSSPKNRSIIKSDIATTSAAIFYTVSGKAQIFNELEQFMVQGGFPESYKIGKYMVANIYNNIITRDIMARYRIRNFRVFQDLARYLITNFSNLFTYSKLRKFLAIGDIHTVQRYTSYLEQSFIIFVIEKFSYKLKTQILSPKKVYVMDMGFVDMMGVQIGKTRGRMIENVVAIELYRRLISRKHFDRFYYWKDSAQYEIDFVLFQQNRIIELIQVSFVHAQEDILPRELKNFEKCAQDLRCERFTLITWDLEEVLDYNGKTITCIPLWKWLLQSGKK